MKAKKYEISQKCIEKNGGNVKIKNGNVATEEEIVSKMAKNIGSEKRQCGIACGA
jgi:hypothetical protein